MLLVVLEHDRGVLGEPAREALTFGRTLAAKMGVEMHAVAVGAGAAAAEQVASACGAHGAVRLYTVDHEVLSDFGPEAWGQSLLQVVEVLEPGAVLACGSERGNEVMAQAAARLDWPFVANCTDVTPPAGGDGQWSMTRIQWGGSLLEDATLEAGTALLTCGLHTVASSPVEPPARRAPRDAGGGRGLGRLAGPHRGQGSGGAGSRRHPAHRAGGGGRRTRRRLRRRVRAAGGAGRAAGRPGRLQPGRHQQRLAAALRPRSARPAPASPRRSTSPRASPAPSSTGWARWAPSTSWPSTSTPRPTWW